MVKNGIVYGKNKPKVLTVVSVTPMHDYRLKVTFSNHETKIFDFIFKYCCIFSISCV